MSEQKQVIGGRQLSLLRAVRAGDMVYLTGQSPMQDRPAKVWPRDPADFAGLDTVSASYFPIGPQP